MKARKPKTLNHPADESSTRLLAGGNPQIAKADGETPVQQYIAAMPGWKSELGRQLDDLISTQVPHVRKAVKWNSAFYGTAEHGWFLSFRVFTRYGKVIFFEGASLTPPLPGGTEKSKQARWIDLYEKDQWQETPLRSWIEQASRQPGWMIP